MKTFLCALTYSLSLAAFAANSIPVKVISAEIGVNDEHNRGTLCLTVVELPKTGDTVAVVEDITDCYYTRAAKKAPFIDLSLADLKPVSEPNLRDHLQSLHSDLAFYFSEVE